MNMIDKDAVLNMIDSNIEPHTHGAWDSGYNVALGEMKEKIKQMPTIEAITREEFIRKAKELITAFVGSGEKTEENRIIFALVFGNLELRLFGSRDGDSE